MSWLTAILEHWHAHNRLLYACVTVAAVAGLGLLFGLLGGWAARKLGIDTSRLKHK